VGFVDHLAVHAENLGPSEKREAAAVDFVGLRYFVPFEEQSFADFVGLAGSESLKLGFVLTAEHLKLGEFYDRVYYLQGKIIVQVHCARPSSLPRPVGQLLSINRSSDLEQFFEFEILHNQQIFCVLLLCSNQFLKMPPKNLAGPSYIL